MSVAFKSQVGVAYYFSSVFEWYGDHAGYIQQNFIKAIDFSFKVNKVDYSEVIHKLSSQFEVLLEDFNFAVKAIDFAFEARDVDYTQDANKIDHSKGLT